MRLWTELLSFKLKAIQSNKQVSITLTYKSVQNVHLPSKWTIYAWTEVNLIV